MVRVFEPPVYCYHEIVHNRLVVDRFRDLGVVFVDDVDEVPDNAPLMLSAHGSAPDVVGNARSRNRFVVNAVCPLVTKVPTRPRCGLTRVSPSLRRPRRPRRTTALAVARRHAAVEHEEDLADVLPTCRILEGRAAGTDDPLAARLEAS
jgi:hypothetical protein